MANTANFPTLPITDMELLIDQTMEFVEVSPVVGKGIKFLASYGHLDSASAILKGLGSISDENADKFVSFIHDTLKKKHTECSVTVNVNCKAGEVLE